MSKWHITNILAYESLPILPPLSFPLPLLSTLPYSNKTRKNKQQTNKQKNTKNKLHYITESKMVKLNFYFYSVTKPNCKLLSLV